MKSLPIVANFTREIIDACPYEVSTSLTVNDITSGKLGEVSHWVRENVHGPVYRIGGELRFRFADHKDAVFFKLRWVG